MLSSELIANWLLRHVDGMLVEKESAEDMEANIEKLLDWKRKINPGIWGKLYL